MAVATEHSLWRFLQEIYDEDLSNVTLSSSASSSASSSGGSADLGRVYWSVLSFIVVLVCVTCAWCWCCADKERWRITTHGHRWWFVGGRRVDSDLAFQRTLRQRHEQRMAARRSTPAKRTARLKKSFVSNKVQMVRQTLVREERKE
jgi:hypothetical protein